MFEEKRKGKKRRIFAAYRCSMKRDKVLCLVEERVLAELVAINLSSNGQGPDPVGSSSLVEDKTRETRSGLFRNATLRNAVTWRLKRVVKFKTCPGRACTTLRFLRWLGFAATPSASARFSLSLSLSLSLSSFLSVLISLQPRR